MEIRIYTITITTLLLFGNNLLIGQKKFDLSKKHVTFDISGQTLQGFQTTFDFGREEVRKGWWRYAKSFGNPLDMRSHYLVTIPSEATDGNVDLTIYSQTFSEQDKIRFNLGLEDKQFQSQLEQLLLDFKRDFYVRYYLREIHLATGTAARISEEYASETQKDRKNQLLNELTAKQVAIKKLKEEIKAIENKRS